MDYAIAADRAVSDAIHADEQWDSLMEECADMDWRHCRFSGDPYGHKAKIRWAIRYRV